MRPIRGSLSIGGLTRTAGVNIETVRFYQRKGLLREPSRAGGGIRRYGRMYCGCDSSDRRSGSDSAWRKSPTSSASKTARTVLRLEPRPSISLLRYGRSSLTLSKWRTPSPSS